MMKIKDLVWEHNEASDLFASPGVECHYIIRTDYFDSGVLVDLLKQKVYTAEYMESGEEFKYERLQLGSYVSLSTAMAACNGHHRNRVTARYLYE